MPTTHAHNKAHHAPTHPLRRPGQRHPDRRALLGATALTWYAGQEGPHGPRPMAASRLLAYFLEHAFSRWFVGRALGIRFTGYGLHGTSHPQHYPPWARFVFSRLPLLSARTDPATLRAATPAARAAMYAAGTVATVVATVVASAAIPRIPGHCWPRGVRGAYAGRGASLWARTCVACRCSSASRCVQAETRAARGGSCGGTRSRRGAYHRTILLILNLLGLLASQRGRLGRNSTLRSADAA
jgi:hypothetical protein